MDATNCQSTMTKALPNQSTCCPWTSRAPVTSPAVGQNGIKNAEQNGSNPTNVANSQTSAGVSGTNNRTINNSYPNMLYRTRAPHCLPTQQSSVQFFHFLRLMQLFPDVHPATIHTVLTLCKHDFFCAVDKLLYAKRCNDLYNGRINVYQRYTPNAKLSRHHPYCFVRSMTSASQTNPEALQNVSNVNLQSLTIQDSNNHGVYAAMAVHNRQNVQSVASTSNENEKVTKCKQQEARKILPRNRAKNKEKQNASVNTGTDLPPVASPQCQLPIDPLSPIPVLPEDLSSQTTLCDSSK